MILSPELSAALIDWLVRTSLDLAWLGVGVLLVTTALGKHLGPRWRYCLWLLVVLRLFVPQPLPQEVLPSAPRLEQDAASQWLSTIWKPAERVGARATEAPSPTADAAPAPLETTSVAPATIALSAAAPPEPAPATPSTNAAILELCLALWLGIAALLWTIGCFRETRFRRALRAAAPIEDPRVLSLYAATARTLGVAAPPRLVATRATQAPCLSGWIAPRIALPDPTWRALGRNALRTVLAHELAHVRRRDVPRQWALHAIGCAFWFHPVLHLALRQLRSTQEELCDLAALQRGTRTASTRYAATLLRLSISHPHVSRTSPTAGALSGARELQRRIRTVMHRQPTRPLIWFPALAALSAFSWLGMTQAAEQAQLVLPAEPSAFASQDSAAAIQVVRQLPAPAWQAPLAEKVRTTRASAAFENAPLAEIAQVLAKLSGCPIAVHPQVENDYGALELTLRGEDTLDHMLDRLTKEHDLHWELEGGAVLIAPRGSNAFSTDLRFYKVAPLIGSAASEEQLSERLMQLQELVIQIGATDPSWNENERVSLSAWREALVVRQTDRQHRRVQAFLELLAARGARPQAARTPAELALETRLEEPCSFCFDGQNIEEVRDVLSKQGLAVHFDADVLESSPEISLVVEGTPLREALTRLAQTTGAHLELRSGELYFTTKPELRVEVFEIGDFVAADDPAQREERGHQLIDMLRQAVSPSSWDELETAIAFWGDLLVVRQKQQNQILVRETLEALRRVRQ
ncbi:MAG: M48 family metalloprotease [Planctomycetes bacterium]|nr:M48 family metalloprotease [Planctomycetota bacterium]